MPDLYQRNSINQLLYYRAIAYDFMEFYIKRQHGMPYYQWLQCAKGQGCIYLNDDKPFILHEGEGILIAPDVPHYYYPAHSIEQPWFTNFVVFAGSFCSELPTLFNYQDVIFTKDSPAYSFSDQVKKIIDLEDEPLTFQEKLVYGGSYLYELLHMISLHNSNNELLVKEPTYQNYVLPTLNIIRTRYHEPLTLNALASQVFISPQYLNRCFKLYFDKTTMQYLSDFRFDMAKDHLKFDKEKSISEVCFSVGFNDVSRFIQSFRKRFDMTPHEFKSQIFL